MAYRHLINFWPLVPALDLQEIVSAANTDKDHQVQRRPEVSYQEYAHAYTCQSVAQTQDDDVAGQPLDFLLLGDSVGSLVKTIARMGRRQPWDTNLNLYLAGVYPESIVRNLLLLSLLCDPGPHIGMLDRSEMFLEILGNTHVRPATWTFVEERAWDIMEAINGPLKFSTLPMVHYDLLKQSEVDDLTGVLSYLRDRESIFEASKGWDSSLRSFYGARYDSRKNLFDYHFHFGLPEDCRMVSVRKYVDWCETGVAFKFRPSQYKCPNKTMHLRSMDAGDSEGCFVGDIATSPYLAFGVECGNRELFKKSCGGDYVCTSDGISKFNVIDMMNEFDAFAGSRGQPGKRLKVRVAFLRTLLKTQLNKTRFDCVYVPCDVMHCAGKFLPGFLRDDSSVAVFETTKNVVNSTRHQKQKHSRRIDELAKSAGMRFLPYGGQEPANHKIFKLGREDLSFD